MKYATIKDAMNSSEGLQLYRLFTEDFEIVLKTDKRLRECIGVKPTFLGSQAYFEHLVWRVLNKLSKG